MDCCDCEYSIRLGDGSLCCDFTGAQVPGLDDRPGLYCPIDMPVTRRSEHDAIAAVLVAAEKRGKLAKLLELYTPVEQWRLRQIVEEWLARHALGEHQQDQPHEAARVVPTP